MGRSSYKRLGDYIQPVDIRNKDNAVENLLGLSMTTVSSFYFKHCGC